MLKLSSLLSKAVKKAGISGRVEDTQITRCFNEIKDKILAPELAKKVRAMYVRKGVLNIASLSEAASKELKMKEAQIIKEINEKFNTEVVNKINYIT